MYLYVEKKEPAEKLEIQDKRTTDGVKFWQQQKKMGSRVLRSKVLTQSNTPCSLCLTVCLHTCTQTYIH